VTPIRVQRSAAPARDPLDLFALSDHPERFYWERPDREEAILALGAVARIEARGASRFEAAARCLGEIGALLQREGNAPAWAGPLLVGGFAFEAEPPPSERPGGRRCGIATKSELPAADICRNRWRVA
jgi:isochorismate synthase EntC